MSNITITPSAASESHSGNGTKFAVQAYIHRGDKPVALIKLAIKFSAVMVVSQVAAPLWRLVIAGRGDSAVANSSHHTLDITRAQVWMNR